MHFKTRRSKHVFISLHICVSSESLYRASAQYRDYTDPLMQDIHFNSLTYNVNQEQRNKIKSQRIKLFSFTK